MAILERFSTIDRSLANSLGKANLQRLQALQHMRSVQEADTEEEAESGPPASSKPGESRFHDSGYASTQTPSVAASLVSSRVSSLAENGLSKWPVFPEIAKSGKPFECAACSKKVTLRNKYEYRRHIIQDLGSYTCIGKGCGSSMNPFKIRRDWINHMLLHHPEESPLETSCCPLCHEQFVEEKYALLAHIAKHLEEISLTALFGLLQGDGDEVDSVLLPDDDRGIDSDLGQNDKIMELRALQCDHDEDDSGPLQYPDNKVDSGLLHDYTDTQHHPRSSQYLLSEWESLYEKHLEAFPQSPKQDDPEVPPIPRSDPKIFAQSSEQGGGNEPDDIWNRPRRPILPSFISNVGTSDLEEIDLDSLLQTHWDSVTQPTPILPMQDDSDAEWHPFPQSSPRMFVAQSLIRDGGNESDDIRPPLCPSPLPELNDG
ncbi:hypothetical protein K402DRAFT_407038 [Aulographum hederae CBS 113979]|uniref:C2H2-type domain-containing protein n=1 Tax=Aulographum hederae CBS 113979 TaxID=1176131 RepID=A0A6G1GQY7_9PEZI|nr:hypothetical protein K402DRAFT_407038 [Aulographum hederae CBS 113979]